MAYRGKLKKVWDNAKGWSLVIEVDDHGERKFTLWDKKYAGQASGEHEAICDVHNWEGSRVVFDVTKGKPKQDGTDACWPSVVDSIQLEGEQPEKSVREMAKEIEEAIEEAGRVATLQAEVAAIEAEMSSEGQQSTQATNEAEVLADGGKADLTRLTMKLINTFGEWATAIEKRTGGES